MFFLGLLLLGLRTKAATVPTLYDVPTNQDNQPTFNDNNQQELSPPGYRNDDNAVPYGGYYQQVPSGPQQPSPMPYLYDQRRDGYDPRIAWYGRPNIQNPDIQSGYYPNRYDVPRYGYPSWYPYGVPYGPLNNYYPYYYPYTYHPYNYGPPPYLPPYGGYVNRPQYSDQTFFNGNPTNQPIPNAGQAYQQPGGNQGQRGTDNMDRQPNYVPSLGTGYQGNGQLNEGQWQYGARGPNNQPPYTQVPYNPITTTYSGSGQPSIPSGNPVGRPAQGNGNGQDQYLYLNGQVGQGLPNISGGFVSNSSYEPFPQQRPSRPRGPQETPQRQYLIPNYQVNPALVGGRPYDPTSQSFQQQAPRYPVTGSDMAPNVRGVPNGQQYPTLQQGTSGNPLSSEEIEAIFGQPLNTPGSEDQGRRPADQGNKQQQEAVLSGTGSVPQEVQTPGNGQSVYIGNGKPLPPELMDEVRRIRSGAPVGNTGK